VAKRRHTAKQVISRLREAEVLLTKGAKMPQNCRQLGVAEQTYHRWRKEYSPVRTHRVKRLEELDKENARLEKVAADQRPWPLMTDAMWRTARQASFSHRHDHRRCL
jgi:putative transposase